jgi:hypothetical protein
MAYGATSEVPSLPKSYTHPLSMSESILRLTQADVLPRPVLRQALTDAYFQHIYPFYPVVDQIDLSDNEGSVLLKQVVCLVGSLMQHDQDSMKLCGAQYDKVKTLIYLNHEADNVAVLKAFCLLTCYSPLPTDQVTLGGPWHWLGMGIRLAIQMGLHKSATYASHPQAGALRRIFWHLVVGSSSPYVVSLFNNTGRIVTGWPLPVGAVHRHFGCLTVTSLPLRRVTFRPGISGLPYSYKQSGWARLLARSQKSTSNNVKFSPMR